MGLILRMEYGTLEVNDLDVAQEYRFCSAQNAKLNTQEFKAEMKSHDGMFLVVSENSLELKKGDEIIIAFMK